MRKPSWLTAIVTLAALVSAAVVVGCGQTSTPVGGAGSSTTAGGGPKVQVVAAENFWGSLAQQLGGDRVSVTSIINDPAADPHDYEPSPSDGQNVASAQMVIVNGIGYDNWTDKLLAASPSSSRTVLNVGNALGIGSDGNPHQWYSPASVQKVIDRTIDDYKRLRPQDAAYFDQQRQIVESQGLGEYNGLVSDIRARYGGTPIAASESIVEPWATDLGLRMLTPPDYLKAISEGSDPSASDKTETDQQITTKQAKVFIYNSQNATPDVQRLKDEAGRAQIPVVTVTETPTPAGASFQDWQVAELRSLEGALATATGR